MVFELYLNKAVRNKTSTQHHRWAVNGPSKPQGDEFIGATGQEGRAQGGQSAQGKSLW